MICCFSQVGLGQSVDISEFTKLFPGEQLNAGFGLARDIVSHVYQGKTFAPRDYDFAVIGTGWSKEKAEKILSQYGTIKKTLDMYKEVIQPSGRVFAYLFGHVIILERDGVQLDFKFFKSYEDAHFRGLFDVEKVLFPLRGRSIGQLISDIRQIKKEGRIPGAGEVSDPYHGVEAIINSNPKTINWAMVQARPLDWVIRGLMIYAKLGDRPIAPREKVKMEAILESVQYMLPRDYALVKRAINHKRWWRVRELLAEIGFFKALPIWRWSEPVQGAVSRWRAESVSTPYCRRVFNK